MFSPSKSAGLSLLAVASMMIAACGGSDSASTDAVTDTTATTEAAEPPTTEPPTTEPPNTEPPSTDPVVSDPPTTEPATTEPATTEPAVEAPRTFTTDEVIAALPTLDDIGEPWTGLDDDEVLVDPPAAEGFGVGTCGGPNAVGRAAPHGVTSVVQSLTTIHPDQRDASTTIYAFADAAGAEQFVASTAELTDCPDGVTWERVQRSEPTSADEFNGFGPGFEEVVDGEIWTFDEYGATAYLPEPDLGADEVLYIGVDQDRQLTAVGITFEETRGIVGRYARYDNVVIVTQMRGAGNYAGWLNIDELVDSLPEFEQLDEYVIISEPLVASRLGLTG